MTAYNGYPLSVLLALALHGLVIGAVLFFQQRDTQALDVVEPPSVQASLVAENPQARNERIQQEQAERRRQQQREREQAQQRREEQQRQQQREEEQRRQEEEQRQREEQRRQEEEQQQREEQRRQEEEQQQREEEQRRREEAQRQREEQQRQQAEAQRQREQQAAAEQAANAERIQSYTSVIHDLVQQNWSRPPSARNGMTAVLRIQLVPTGEVVDVEVVQSSGNAAFDRSAANAVHAVGQFTELQDMPPRMFERNFRSFLLTFRPEDLLN